MPRKKSPATPQNEPISAQTTATTPAEGNNETHDNTQGSEQTNIAPIQNAEKPAKKKRNRPDLKHFGYELAEPGDNAKYIRFARDNMNRPPIDISDEKQVEQRINEYFIDCENADMKPSVVGLANALGVDRMTLWQWKTGVTRTVTHTNLIKKAYNALEEQWVDYMQNGKVNPASGIFLGKNHFSYRDVADVVVSPGQRVSDQASPEMIEAQLKALPGDDD